MPASQLHNPLPHPQHAPRSRRARRAALVDPTRDDPFYYGFRYETRRDAAGREKWVQVPLPASAFLDPQEGDHLMQGAPHEPMVQALVERLRTFYASSPDVGILADRKLCWGIADLSEPCPDVAIVPGMRDQEKRRGVFDVQEEGVLPSLVIEVVSPKFKAGDYEDKPQIYRRAGVEEFLIVDPTGPDDSAPIILQGFQLSPTKHRYQRWQPDEDGWLRSRTTGLGFRPATIPNPTFPWADRLQVMDLATGNLMPRALESEAARQAAEQAAAESEAARQAAEAELAVLKARFGLV